MTLNYVSAMCEGRGSASLSDLASGWKIRSNDLDMGPLIPVLKRL